MVWPQGFSRNDFFETYIPVNPREPQKTQICVSVNPGETEPFAYLMSHLAFLEFVKHVLDAEIKWYVPPFFCDIFVTKLCH